MLSCKIGNKGINTIEYTDTQLRKWSDKGVLKCPLCEGKMTYRNGNYKIAHFSHEHSCTNENGLIYSHPETQEHVNGKKVLFEWLKTQPVNNLKLEAWIPETKQRPDIYFEYNEEKYVIEYQCSPVSTEYDNRRELYSMAGIKDIWILGRNKYDITSPNELMYQGRNTKTIERDIMTQKEFPLMYLSEGRIYFTSSEKRRKITEVVKFTNPYKSFNLFSCGISDILNLNSYENLKYKRNEDRIKQIIYNIKNDLYSNYGIKNINIIDNKLYTFYGNVKKMIHVCWDESELCDKSINSRTYDYVPIIVSNEFVDFYINDRFNKFKDPNYKLNYVNKGKYFTNTIFGQTNIFDFQEFNTYKSHRKFKKYEIFILDSFYKSKHKNEITLDKFCRYDISKHERVLSLKLKANEPNYIKLSTKEKGLRMTEYEMEWILRDFEREGYKNINITWG